MSARAGMANMIALLRAACNAGTADYVIGGVTFWTDDQLQAELDRTQRTYHQVYCEPVPVYNNIGGVGRWQWYDYAIPYQIGTYIEEGFSADSGWAIKTSQGATIDPSNYSVDYEAKKITFNTDHMGTVIFLDAQGYNLNRAAARVWQKKASYFSTRVDWSTDNTRISASGAYQQAKNMAEYYDGLAGPLGSTLYRTDEL